MATKTNYFCDICNKQIEDGFKRHGSLEFKIDTWTDIPFLQDGRDIKKYRYEAREICHECAEKIQFFLRTEMNMRHGEAEHGRV